MNPRVRSRPVPARELIVALLALSVLPGVLLLVDPGGWFPFGPVKWWAASTLSALALLAVLSRREPLRGDRTIVMAWAILLIVLAAAALLGVDGRYAWIGTPERRLGWVTWFGFAILHLVGRNLEPTAVRRVLRILLPATAVGVGGVALLQVLGVRPGPLALGGSRPGSTLGSAALLGSVAVLLLPPTIGLAVDARRRGRTGGGMVAGLASVVLIVALLASGTRGAWFGLLVAGGVVMLRRRRRDPAGPGRFVAGGPESVAVDHRGPGASVPPWSTTPNRRRPGVSGVFGMLGMLAVVCLSVLASNPVATRLGSLGDRGAPGGLARLDEWRVATRMIGSAPILGVGPEGYRIAFPASVDDAYERAHGRDPLPDRAHSAPLDLAATGGLAGLTAWTGLWILVGRRVLVRIRSGDVVDAGLGAGILGAFAASFVLFPALEVDAVLWLFVGLLMGGMAQEAGAAGDNRAPTGIVATVALAPAPVRPAPIVTRWRRPIRAAVAVIGLALFAGGLVGVLADRRAADAVTALRRGDDTAAVTAAQRAVDLRPDVLRHHLLLAELRMATGGGHRAAAADLERARPWSPDDPILRLARTRLLVGLAEATRLPGDLDRASDAVGELLAADPSLADGWVLSERVGRLRGRPDQVRVAIARVAELRIAPGMRIADGLLPDLDRRIPDDARLGPDGERAPDGASDR